MIYQNFNNGNAYPYPNHDVDPAKKGAEWCMQYAKAAYYDFSYTYVKGVFSNNGGDYQKYRLYALGKQPINQYKKLMGVDQLSGETLLVVDWSIRSIISGYRDKAISRLMKEDYSIIATPVDMLAKTEIDEYYAEIKSKLVLRDMMVKDNPEMANHPLLKLSKSDPQDLEELEMRIESGEQFNRAKDAELAIDLGFYENNYKSWRRSIYEDLFDYGVAGVKDWLGDDNKAKFRRVNPENVVISYAKDGTFSDIVHAGEQIDVSLVELATITDSEGNLVFTEKELQEFAGSLAGKFGNPTQLGNSVGWMKPYDKFKCKVLDIEFYTYNESSYRDAPDEYGNTDFRKADYNRGKKSDKYKRKKIQYVYKCKWVVGTDKCYDYGMCYNQKRTTDLKRKAKTKLSYTFCAYNFYEMRCQGFMERLIPYIDDYQLTMLKIQNFKNRAVPSGWWIDLDGLENVALNKGGKNMTPKELLTMFQEMGILVGRSKDAAGNPQNQNWKPIIPIQNTIMAELVGFYQDLMNTVMAIEKMTGYNDITSGNPNPKTLTTGYEIANESTNDALYPITYAETYLTTQLAEQVLTRMKQGVVKGEVEGYAPYSSAINSNSLRFVKLDEGLAARDYGITLEKRTTEQEKIWLLQQVNGDIANGLLNVSDAILIINTHNVKQAMQLLAYRVKKAKEQAQEYELQKLQEVNQGNAQMQQMAQQARMQEIELENALKFNIKQAELEAQIMMNRDKLQTELQMKMIDSQTKAGIGTETAEAKIISSQIAADATKEKQVIANAKPKASV